MIQKNINELPINMMGRILYHCLSKRRKIALQNIHHVFKNTLSDNQKKRLTKAFFSHIARTISEIFLIHCCKTKFQPKFEIRNSHHLIEAMKLGKGVILLSCHLGNWEFCILNTVAVEKLHGRFNVIRKQQASLIQKWLNTYYSRAHIKIFDKNGALQKALSALTNQEIVLFTFDQHMRLDKTHSIPVEFFGAISGCSRGLAVLAKRSGAVVLPVNNHREGKNNHVVEFLPALSWIDSDTKEQEMYENTLQYNQVLEKIILKNPEQWWSWLHRHWHDKLDFFSHVSIKSNEKN